MAGDIGRDTNQIGQQQTSSSFDKLLSSKIRKSREDDDWGGTRIFI
jgi:hypothetical protein